MKNTAKHRGKKRLGSNITLIKVTNDAAVRTIRPASLKAVYGTPQCDIMVVILRAGKIVN